MVRIVQQISDRLLNLVMPRVSAQACRRYLSTCVSCPRATGYLFRRMEKWTCCNVFAAECTFYGPCSRSC